MQDGFASSTIACPGDTPIHVAIGGERPLLLSGHRRPFVMWHKWAPGLLPRGSEPAAPCGIGMGS
jgi:hypothetical protein